MAKPIEVDGLPLDFHVLLSIREVLGS